MLVITEQTFDEEVKGSSEPVLVDFWAEWCGPCKMIAPILEEIAGEKSADFKIVKLNVDDNPTSAQKYGVMSIPTLLLFKDGKESARIVGYKPKEKLLREIDSGLKAAV